MVKRKSETLGEEIEDDEKEDNGRSRKRLEEYQVKGLEEYFMNVDIYPNSEKKDELAAQLQLKSETVSKWFINRRVKLRKEGRGDDGSGEVGASKAEDESSMSRSDRLRGIKERTKTLQEKKRITSQSPNSNNNNNNNNISPSGSKHDQNSSISSSVAASLANYNITPSSTPSAPSTPLSTAPPSPVSSFSLGNVGAAHNGSNASLSKEGYDVGDDEEYIPSSTRVSSSSTFHYATKHAANNALPKRRGRKPKDMTSSTTSSMSSNPPPAKRSYTRSTTDNSSTNAASSGNNNNNNSISTDTSRSAPQSIELSELPLWKQLYMQKQWADQQTLLQQQAKKKEKEQQLLDMTIAAAATNQPVVSNNNDNHQESSIIEDHTSNNNNDDAVDENDRSEIQQKMLMHIYKLRLKQRMPPVFGMLTGPSIQPYRVEEQELILGRNTYNHREADIHVSNSTNISYVHAKLQFDPATMTYHMLNISRRGFTIKLGEEWLEVTDFNQRVPLPNPAVMNFQGTFLFFQVFSIHTTLPIELEEDEIPREIPLSYDIANSTMTEPPVATEDNNNNGGLLTGTGRTRRNTRGFKSYAEMIAAAIIAYGGIATYKQINEHIAANFQEDIATRKTWKNSVGGVLSSSHLFDSGPVSEENPQKKRGGTWRISDNAPDKLKALAAAARQNLENPPLSSQQDSTDISSSTVQKPEGENTSAESIEGNSSSAAVISSLEELLPPDDDPDVIGEDQQPASVAAVVGKEGENIVMVGEEGSSDDSESSDGDEDDEEDDPNNNNNNAMIIN